MLEVIFLMYVLFIFFFFLVDCWDGLDGYFSIYYGYTFIFKIKFFDVLRVIKDYVWVVLE